MRSYKYTDDQGNVFQRACDKALADQNGAGGDSKVGAVPAVGTEPMLPRGLKPRTATVVAPDGVKSRVVCFTKDADLYTGTETSITLHDAGGQPTVCTFYNSSGERKRKRAPGV